MVVIVQVVARLERERCRLKECGYKSREKVVSKKSVLTRENSRASDLGYNGCCMERQIGDCETEKPPPTSTNSKRGLFEAPGFVWVSKGGQEIRVGRQRKPFTL